MFKIKNYFYILPTLQIEAAAKSQQQIRALIGQGQSHGTPHGQSHGIQLQAVSSVNTSVSGRPIVKGKLSVLPATIQQLQ